MAATEILAAGWTFAVGLTTIAGIDSFSISQDAKEADTTTFDDVGFESSLITRRAKILKLTGKYQEDGASQDAGQAAVEVLGAAVGAAAVGAFVIASPGGSGNFSMNATVKMDEIGGGNDDATKWGCTLTRVGADTA